MIKKVFLVFIVLSASGILLSLHSNLSATGEENGMQRSVPRASPDAGAGGTTSARKFNAADPRPKRDILLAEIQSLEVQINQAWEKLGKSDPEIRLVRELLRKYLNWDYRENWGEYDLVRKWVQNEPAKENLLREFRRRCTIEEARSLMSDPNHGMLVRSYFEKVLRNSSDPNSSGDLAAREKEDHQWAWDQFLETDGRGVAPPSVISGLLSQSNGVFETMGNVDEGKLPGVVVDFTRDSVRANIVAAMAGSKLAELRTDEIAKMELRLKDLRKDASEVQK